MASRCRSPSKEKTLRFFTADPGIVRVLAGDRELVYSLTLPQPGDTAWKPSNVKVGLPGRAPAGPISRDIWQWLAIAGAAGLLADWILFGRIDRRSRAASGAAAERCLEESFMTFERAWVLVFLLLPLGWVFRVAADAARHSPAAEDAVVPCHRLGARGAHAHRSPNENGRGGSGGHFRQRRAARFGARLRIRIRFGQGARPPLDSHPAVRAIRSRSAPEEQRGYHLQLTAGEAGRATDLESSIDEAISSLPSGLVPRLVLVSDGKENAGSITRAAWQAQRLGIPIDTIPMQGRPSAESAPRIGYRSHGCVHRRAIPRGSQHCIAVRSFGLRPNQRGRKNCSDRIREARKGRQPGSRSRQLDRGRRVEPHRSDPDQRSRRHSIRSRPHAAPSQGSVYLARPRGHRNEFGPTLAAAQFDVDRTADPSHGSLADYQLVVLNNLDLESLPAARKDEIEKFVQQGGGLLVIAGERNIYAENKKVEDALDRTLPAKLAPPRSPEGTAVVMIIDKSSSMEGKKIELARQAAIGVVENLRPIDLVGVLIFDNSFQWDVPMRRAEDKVLIKRLISGIVPDGGTQIAPALAEAYHKVLPAHATFKHIVLLTDGISEEGDSLDLSKEAAAQHVTISTVGLGQDVNRAYLEKVASVAGGKSYFLNEPAGLEQIVLKDVMEHTGSTAVEKTLQPVVAKNTEILDGVGIDTAPPLKGYVRFISKPGADTILKVDETDPLLVRWQYGLGRAVVFTSDAKSRWAADWVTWKGFDKFWTNTMRDLLPHAESSEAKAEYDSASGDLVVNYHLGGDAEDPAKPPEVFVLGPNGFRHPVPVAKLAGKSYRGRIHIGDLQGLFRVRPLEDSRAFPEIGFYQPGTRAARLRIE
jgi:Ca-activated chloride channel family protein